MRATYIEIFAENSVEISREMIKLATLQILSKAYPAKHIFEYLMTAYSNLEPYVCEGDEDVVVCREMLAFTKAAM